MQFHRPGNDSQLFPRKGVALNVGVPLINRVTINIQ